MFNLYIITHLCVWLYFSYLFVTNHKINMTKSESFIHQLQHVSILVNFHLTSNITNYFAAQKEDESFPFTWYI